LTQQVCDFYTRYSSGDLSGAQAIVRSLFPVLADMESGKFIQKVKYGCELAGFDAGKARMPLQPLTTEEKASFRKAYELAQG
jgi:4-hydroxy-tetrahydrodipicolinate synthase